MTHELNIVILAAGAGTRMYSDVPKVLHCVGGKPLLQHVIETSKRLKPSKLIVVYGHGGNMVPETIKKSCSDSDDIIWVKQERQLGTGHALKCAANYLDVDAATMLLYGDVPLIGLSTLELMWNKYTNNVVVLTQLVNDSHGYGRILRNEVGRVIGIIDEKDADVAQRQINEINTGIYIFANNKLDGYLERISNTNQQGEYYVTDIIAMAYADGVYVDSVLSGNDYESLGVNNKLQLEYLERRWQMQMAEELLVKGVTLVDKTKIEVRGSLEVGRDCRIDINCIFEGKVVLGNNVIIGAGCILKNTVIDSDVEVKPYSIMEGALIGVSSMIGPFARLRPGANLGSRVHVGNFVEVKNSQIGSGSKANHLTYLGDCEVGSGVNIGAGSITCNYDGKNKFKTTIEDGAFIGSGTMMVAPVILGSGCVIGAGSVITKDAPKNELTVARSKQLTIVGYLKRKTSNVK